MEKQKKMKYCSLTTTEHPIAKSYSCCIESIDSISKEAGASRSPFNNEKVINLDKVEHRIAKEDKTLKRKTIDAVFGVSNNKENPKMVLCEYKLKVNNPRSIKEKDLNGKIDGSKEIIRASLQFYNPYLFIFSDSFKPEAYNKIRRLYKNSNICLALTLDELKEKFF